MKYRNTMRWILLIPGTVGSALLAVACSAGVAAWLIPVVGDNIAISMVAVVTPIVWVSASRFIAPAHHVLVMWVSFLCGAALAAMFGWLGGIAIVSGFATVVYYSWALRQATTTEAQ